MEKFIQFSIGAALLLLLVSCDPQMDDIGEIGAGPTSAHIEVDASDPWNPVFTVVSDNAFVYNWVLGPNGKQQGNQVTTYLPISGDYTISCRASGEGGKFALAEMTYTVGDTDPKVGELPVWKELTGGGAGRTWVYDTDTDTGSPDYCHQTAGKEDMYFDPNGSYAGSWGQCVQVTEDIKGAMVFDLNGGVNYTYHHVDGDAGIKGSFLLDPDAMTITVVDPYILDYNVECTNSEVTSRGIYEIKELTDDVLILWQDQEDKSASNPWSTGWTWRFKRKGS